MEIYLHNFWAKKINYFPIVHISYEAKHNCHKAPILQLGLLGFCLNIVFKQKIKLVKL